MAGDSESIIDQLEITHGNQQATIQGLAMRTSQQSDGHALPGLKQMTGNINKKTEGIDEWNMVREGDESWYDT